MPQYQRESNLTRTEVKIFGLLGKRALVTRDSARMIGKALTADSVIREGDVVLDFKGVEAVSPSFVDEAVAVVEELLKSIGSRGSRILFANPPTRLSAKFEAIARGHDLLITELDDGAWALTQGGSTKGE